MKKFFPVLFLHRPGSGHKVLGTFLLCMIFCFNLQAQGIAKKNIYSVLDIGYSTAYFTGRDLPFRSNKSLTPGLTIGIMTKQSARIHDGFRFTTSYPGSKGIGLKNDDPSSIMFIHYQTRIHKYDFFLVTDLIEHRGRYQKRPDFVPYIYSGIGWIKFKQFVRSGYEAKQQVNSLTYRSYDRRSMVLSPGLGLRYKLSKMMDLSVEIIYNYTFSRHIDLDYMDNFKYAAKRDSYLNINLKLGYI